jgi:hypothetical protein
MAVVYYPSEKGSQFAKHVFDKAHPAPPPGEWDEHIKHGLSDNDPHVQAIMRQACHLYPFLENYAVVDKTICRTVFNAAAQDSEKGLDRRVRSIIGADAITDDNRVVAYRSPKWTNAELVALMAASHAMETLRGESLPRSVENGFGPENLDVEKISQELNFRDIKMRLEDALHYIKKHDLPARLVDPSLGEFRQLPKPAEAQAASGRGRAQRQ